MNLASHRLRRRIRETTDEGRNPAGSLQLLRGFTQTHPGDEDGWTPLAQTLHDLGLDTEADLVATHGLEVLSFQYMPLWELLLDILVARGEFDRAAQDAATRRDVCGLRSPGGVRAGRRPAGSPRREADHGAGAGSRASLSASWGGDRR